MPPGRTDSPLRPGWSRGILCPCGASFFLFVVCVCVFWVRVLLKTQPTNKGCPLFSHGHWASERFCSFFFLFFWRFWLRTRHPPNPPPHPTPNPPALSYSDCAPVQDLQTIGNTAGATRWVEVFRGKGGAVCARLWGARDEVCARHGS